MQVVTLCHYVRSNSSQPLLNSSLSQLTIIITTTTTMTQSDVPATDPAVYEAYKTQWASLPDTADAWLARAREVATVLSQDAAQREQENKSPRAEVALLKHSGLLKLLGPKKYGGGEQPWSVGYKAIREVAKGDGYTLHSPAHSIPPTTHNSNTDKHIDQSACS